MNYIISKIPSLVKLSSDWFIILTMMNLIYYFDTRIRYQQSQEPGRVCFLRQETHVEVIVTGHQLQKPIFIHRLIELDSSISKAREPSCACSLWTAADGSPNLKAPKGYYDLGMIRHINEN